MSRVHFLDSLTHPLFFESFDRFEINESDFLLPVKGMLHGDWSFTRRAVWFNCTPPEERLRDLPAQGWKIHVSSSVTNALDILNAVVPVLDAQGISFKFALDRNVLQMMNGKGWERQGAGKFVTIYPVDRAEFVDLIEDLHGVTRGFEGLYILSDRRYKDSKVLFYRYGGIRPQKVANERGEQVSMLTSPSGEQVPDERKPVFHVPAWERDPFPEENEDDPLEVDEKGRIALKGGRYLVKTVFGYTNSGGVYVADDAETGDEVIVKEARPFAHFGEDSIALLHKEHRLLSRIAGAGKTFAPRPIDLFRDWEHHFLVQELIEGIQLRAFSASTNVTLMTAPKLEDTVKSFDHFKEIFIQLARIVADLHALNIVYSDFSPSNVLVLTDPLQIRIIDLEAAHELGVDSPPRVYTLGFAYRDQMYGGATRFENDYFALGALMHYFIAPVNQIFGIAPRSRFTFLKAIVEDIGYPDEVHQTIVSLIENAADERPKPSAVIEVLDRDYALREPRLAEDDETAHTTYERFVDRICEYALAFADYDRKDRLFPAYGTIFQTNPLSLSYGACGVAHAIQFTGRNVPEAVTDWILQPTGDRDSYPPGLYMGLSGLAWTVLDLGRRGAAQRIMALSYVHPLRHRSFDLFNGVAGCGLASLKLFLELGDELYLSAAVEAGELLLRSARRHDKGTYWPADDKIPLGLAHGSSGISLFLLYLHLASGREDFLDAGVGALDYDLNSGVPTRDDGLSWRRYDDDATIIYPYWRYGSAGIGMTLIRYHWLLEESRYRGFIERIFVDLNRKYAIYPGLFIGLTGLGETLLDFYRFTGEERFYRAAHRVATGLSLFRIERDEGLAFPGDGLTRICCDLATGSVGAGRFFHRLVHGGPAPLLLDELLVRARETPVVGARREPVAAESVAEFR